MIKIDRHIVSQNKTMRDALNKLNLLGSMSRTLFVLDHDSKMVGTITDGDIRRALLAGHDLDSGLSDFMTKEFRFLVRNRFKIDEIDIFRKDGIQLIPILSEAGMIDRVIDFSQKRSILPIEAVIMAGGRGERLRPLTDDVPKPLLPLDGKPIMQYNLERLDLFGVDKVYITINYLGNKIKKYFSGLDTFGFSISYIEESRKLGTIGSLTEIEQLKTENLLVMNSDLLTNIDFEDFFRSFIASGADMMVATTPYQVKLPYAVIEASDNQIISFQEKPTYTYYSNAGIYLLKSELVELIPKSEKYNATDLMRKILENQGAVLQYPIRGYWLDIGRPEEYQRAQNDIQHINF